MSKYFDIPLFPLSAHLLPGGRMSLRIFEPRYTRMIKQACATDSGFVLLTLTLSLQIRIEIYITREVISKVHFKVCCRNL